MASDSRQLSYGRSAFGEDPQRYASARPAYPPVLYEWLAEICGITGKRMFEVGPGTGIATARLLEMGPAALTAIEPDARLADHLARALGDHPQLAVVVSTFEDAALEPAAFDVGVAAMSFHWLDQEPALAKVFEALRPGGWWAMWWNVYGDPEEQDAFAEAARAFFRSLPTMRSWDMERGGAFTVDAPARLADLARAGFVDTGARVARWPCTMDADQIVALASSWSVAAVMGAEERKALLDGLRDLVDREFGGGVKRTFLTPLYVGRKA